MATLGLLPDGDRNVGGALYAISNLDTATITSTSSTLITLTDSYGGIYQISGTAFTTTIINGVEYINGGTIDSISINYYGYDYYLFDDLAMTGATLRNAMRADIEGTNQKALEDLFRKLTYTINGDPNSDNYHYSGATSYEGYSLEVIRSNTYNLGSGGYIYGAGPGNDTMWGGYYACIPQVACRLR